MLRSAPPLTSGPRRILRPILARPLRLEIPGALWHVTSRGNEQRNIVRNDSDRHDFVRLLAEVVREYHWLLHAWVLMDNHYHLLIETPEATLSDGVKWLNQNYVQRFNRRYRRAGHLFQGRFKGILVEREGHLLELLRYVVLNPVRCGIARFAADYRWSSYRATAGLITPPSWLTIAWTLERFGGGDRASAQEAYRQFVADGRGAAYNPWESLQAQMYLGGESFRKEMQKHVEEQVRSMEHPRAQRQVVAKPDLALITSHVAAAFGLAAEDLRERVHRPARNAVALLATENGWSLAEAGQWLKVSGPGVSKMCHTGRQLVERDSSYEEKIDAIRKKLTIKT